MKNIFLFLLILISFNSFSQPCPCPGNTFIFNSGGCDTSCYCIKRIKVTLTDTEIKSSNSAPILVPLPASPLNTYYRVVNFDCLLHYNGTPFNNTSSLNIAATSKVGTLLNAQLNNTCVGQTTSDLYIGFNGATAGTTSGNGIADNDTLSIFGNADSVTGNSTVDCYIYYYIGKL